MDNAFEASAGDGSAQPLHSPEKVDQESGGVESRMLPDVSRILALTPQQRLQELANVSKFIASARRE